MPKSDPETVATSDIPPAPWHLTGSACVSLWRLPTSRLPAPALGLEYASFAGQSLVMTVWAAYTGGTLVYDELAVVVPVRGQGMLAATGTVVNIWVDDPVSCAGGRTLWSIPKQMAEFETAGSADRGGFTGAMRVDGAQVAGVQFEPRFDLPGRPSLGGFVVQPGENGPIRTRCSARGKISKGAAEWDFAEGGPLGFLAGCRPIFSARILDLQGAFGI